MKKVTWDDMKQRKSDIDPIKLRTLARKHKYPNDAILDRILTDLREGARIGVKDKFRVGSISTNAPSAINHGEEVTDALLDWIDEGYVIGPFNKDEVPFETVKVSGMMCRLKPNGKARIIINLSKGNPVSVNEGINKLNFPTAMSSTKAWVRIMMRCGKNWCFAKCDWSRAYKHIRVNPDDVWMQGFA